MTTEAAAEPDLPRKPVCGIVMPIADMGEPYTTDHWQRVRNVLSAAAEKAGVSPQLVWEDGVQEEWVSDAILTRILRNLLEADVVVADVSNLNPNVMFEVGIRLATKKPTIIVSDLVKRPAFDLSPIGHIKYPLALEWNETGVFVAELSDRISKMIKPAQYKPFMENFKFETVLPKEESVTADYALSERLDEILNRLSRLEGRLAKPAVNALASLVVNEHGIGKSHLVSEEGHPPGLIALFTSPAALLAFQDEIKTYDSFLSRVLPDYASAKIEIGISRRLSAAVQQHVVALISDKVMRNSGEILRVL